jgi:quercetin dioxygenase-like cupin family protein
MTSSTQNYFLRGTVLSALLITSLALAGCSGNPSTSNASTSDASTSDAATIPPIAPTFGSMTMLNGETLPGVMLPLQNDVTMLDTIDADGNRLLVTQGTRLAGTRVAIHVHKYGGHTCVLSGVITDFAEGEKSKTYPAGTCYYMPPNIPMSAANLGTEDAVLIDTFILPVGEARITILEPGWPQG